MEQHFIQAQMIEKGISIRAHTNLDAIAKGAATASCVFTGRAEDLEADAVVLVTSRAPRNALANDLKARESNWADAGVESVTVIGDALAPGTIAHAVYAGRRYAEELDGEPVTGDSVPFGREIAELAPH